MRRERNGQCKSAFFMSLSPFSSELALLVICLMLWLKNFLKSGFVQGNVHTCPLQGNVPTMSIALFLLCWVCLIFLFVVNASFKKQPLFINAGLKNSHCSLSHTWHNLRAGESELPQGRYFYFSLFLGFFFLFIGSLIFLFLVIHPCEDTG